MALEACARQVLLSTPTRAAGPNEARMPAYRYGIVLLLLFATFVFLAIGPTGDWVPLVAVILQGATLLAALSASRTQVLGQHGEPAKAALTDGYHLAFWVAAAVVGVAVVIARTVLRPADQGAVQTEADIEPQRVLECV
jgi:hypothetical protein